MVVYYDNLGSFEEGKSRLKGLPVPWKQLPRKCFTSVTIHKLIDLHSNGPVLHLKLATEHGNFNLLLILKSGGCMIEWTTKKLRPDNMGENQSLCKESGDVIV